MPGSTLMRDQASPAADSQLPRVATAALGGLLGALAGATLVIGFTEVLKVMLAFVSSQATWVLIVVPLLGLALSVLVLYGLGLNAAAERPHSRWARAWRAFPPGVPRAD